MTSQRVETLVGSLSPADARMVRRLVGFLEYGRALDHFDELLRRVTDDERNVIDQMIAEEDAFSIYSNLARRVQPPGGTLTVQSSAGDDGRRRGLAWVMALARVELGAMLATFTSTPEPFRAVRPTRFEFQAYKSLLLDGAQTHYWALSQDPDLRKVTRTSPVNPIVLSYSRRLVLARAMLAAAVKTGLGEYTPYQLRELASWTNDLDGLQIGLLALIHSYMQAQTRVSDAQTQSREFIQACAALLRAEKKELRRGTAKVKTYTNQ